MRNLLYLTAVILIVALTFGFIGYGTGGLIYIVLVIALITGLLRVIQDKNLI